MQGGLAEELEVYQVKDRPGGEEGQSRERIGHYQGRVEGGAPGWSLGCVVAGAQWGLGLSAGSVGFIRCVKETAFSEMHFPSGMQSEHRVRCGGWAGGGDAHQTILSSNPGTGKSLNLLEPPFSYS